MSYKLLLKRQTDWLLHYTLFIMSGKPNLNFPILSFETIFNLLPDAQPSFESNPPSQWHTFLFVQT